MSSLPITVMPWHKPDPCMPPKMQTPAAFNSSYLEYMSNLSIESKLLPSPLSVIMCTIGPSTNNRQSLISLMESGMSFALVQMSSGSREEVQDTIQLLQSAVSENSIAHDRVMTLTTAVQLKPPGVHIGTLDRGRTVTLQAGDTFTLTTNFDWKYRCNSKFCYFDLPNAGDILNREDEIIVGNGAVRLIVDEVANNNITCNVTESGQLLSNMKVSIPGVPLHLGAVTEQDKDDLAFISLQSNVDAVVVTSTKSANHIIEIRRLLKSNDSDLRVLARIDSKSGIDNLNEIAREADGVVLARNELAAEIEIDKLLLSQKIAFATCNKIGKPVFVCAEYMESMLHLKNPKFSEIIDVQSAILDGADGVLLEAVTAEGQFAEQAVKVVTSSCREAEAAVWQNQIFDSLLLLAMPPMDPAHAISIGAVDTALKSCASAIILATTSGRAAQIVSRYRPRCPIIAVTRYGRVARQLNMWRAVLPVHYISQPFPDWNKEVDVRLQMGIELGKEKKIIEAGDPIVLLSGWRQGAGFTNTIRVVYASDSNPWVYPHSLPSRSVNVGVGIGHMTMDRTTSFSSLLEEAEKLHKMTSYSLPSTNLGENGRHSFEGNMLDSISEQNIRQSLKQHSRPSLEHTENGKQSLRKNSGLSLEMSIHEKNSLKQNDRQSLEHISTNENENYGQNMRLSSEPSILREKISDKEDDKSSLENGLNEEIGIMQNKRESLEQSSVPEKISLEGGKGHNVGENNSDQLIAAQEQAL